MNLIKKIFTKTEKKSAGTDIGLNMFMNLPPLSDNILPSPSSHNYAPYTESYGDKAWVYACVNVIAETTSTADFVLKDGYISVANEPTATGANIIAEDIAEDFVSGVIDKIEIITTHFNNMMSYNVVSWELLPVKAEKAEEHELDPVMEYEPSAHGVLQQLVPMYITNSIYQALLEANASELASRMTAMSAASNNAEEMINTLTIDYNKARQWAITQELVEIVSGAAAI